MPDAPRYTELVPVPDGGLIEASALPYPLPFGLAPRVFLRMVQDVHDVIHRLNTALFEANHAPLEDLLDPAGFSGMISRTVASRLAAASLDVLVVNTFHNGYPDLVRKGVYPKNAIQHGSGLEVKASRSAGNWQAHGKRSGWFVWVQLAIDEREDVATFDREPTHVEAVMVADLAEEDWSWQPAAAGSIRSGTASVKPTGRAKLRAGAVWVAPSYAEEHARLFAAARSAIFDQNTADAAVRAALAASPEALTSQQVAALIAPAFGVPEARLAGRVEGAFKRFRKSDTIAKDGKGYRLTP